MKKRKTPESGETSPTAIVAIGASAGGLAALRALLGALPEDTGFAYLVLQHQQPDRHSLLPGLLAEETYLPVREAADGEPLRPDHIHVAPPGSEPRVSNGVLRVEEPQGGRALRPIDALFRSLAAEQGERAIGVVLSGSGSDGTEGLRAIKAAGGLTFAQDEASAELDGMPRSAARAGVVDAVLPPEQIADRLGHLSLHKLLSRADRHDGDPLPASKVALSEVFALLRERSGQDFSLYKPQTIKRRIQRRMLLHHLTRLEEYVRLLRESPEERDELRRDILINATGFFRDPEGFAAIAERVFPDMLQARQDDEGPVRIWVAACSSGEEAYSLAMLWVEHQEGVGHEVPMQIFASDIDEAAVEQARHGFYPPERVLDAVSPQRRERFFTDTGKGFLVKRALREMCVFAVQDVLTDPPFSRIDLILCRNLLIYLQPPLQEKALRTLHFALRPPGFLLLGPSETIGARADLFRMLDNKARLYARKAMPEGASLPRPARAPGIPETAPGLPQREPRPRKAGLAAAAESVLRERYLPPGVIVDDGLNIQRFIGDTSPFVVPAAGLPSFNLMQMVEPGLAVHLSMLVQETLAKGQATHRQGVRFRHGARSRSLDLHVEPLRDERSGQLFALVLFQTSAQHDTAAPPGNSNNLALEQELIDTRLYLHDTVARLQAANEDLLTANEENLSANEELQSTNEELETAKEELQTANEELVTINDELAERNEELTHANEDLRNLLLSVDMPVVMLSPALRVRRFTPPAARLLNLIDSDNGRPLSDLRLNFRFPGLQEALREVDHSGQPQTHEIEDEDGRAWSLRLLPFRTDKGRDAGTVMVFTDIEDLRELDRRERRLAAVVRDANDAITLLDFEGRFLAWNPAAASMYGYGEAEALGMQAYALIPEEERPAFRELLARLRSGQEAPLTEGRRIARDGRELTVLLTASPLQGSDGTPEAVIATERDITQRKRIERALVESEQTLRSVLDSAGEGIFLMDTAGVCRVANPACVAMLGWRDTTDLVGKEAHTLFHHSRADGSPYPQEDCTACRTFRTGEVTRADDEVFWRADGTAIPVDFESHPVRRNGRLAGAVVTFMDIRERKATEEALRRSEARYRSLFDDALDLIHIVGPDGRILDVNAAELRALGREAGEMIGSRLLEHIAPECRETTAALFERVLKGEAVPRYETALRTRDGRTLPVEASVTPQHVNGEVVATRAICRDLSASKRYLNALHGLYEAAPLGMGMMVDRVFTEVNDTFCTLLGYRREELIGRSARMIYSDQAEFERVGREKYQQIREAGKGAVQARLRRKDGMEIDVWLSSAALDQDDLSAGVMFSAMELKAYRHSLRR